MFEHNYCKTYILLLYCLALDSRSEAEQSNAYLKGLQDENRQLPNETPPILFIIQFCAASPSPKMHYKFRDSDHKDELTP